MFLKTEDFEIHSQDIQESWNTWKMHRNLDKDILNLWKFEHLCQAYY